MPGIGVITNPRSRRNRRNPALARQLAYVLGEQGRLAAPQDREALHRVAEHFLEREIDVLAVNGGDGTLHVVLTALAEVYGDRPLPRIAPLRGGTMNTIAAGLGIRGRPDQLLGRLVAAYHAGEPLRECERDTIRAGRQVGFIFGNGLVSNFLDLYYGRSSAPTPAWAAWLFARAALSALIGGGFARRITRRFGARVQLDGLPLPHEDWLALVASTVDDIGLGFRPFTQVLRHRGAFEVLGFACTASRIVASLPRIRLGLPFRHPDIDDALGERLVLESEQPLDFMIDGDFHRGSQRLELGLGPRVRFVLP